MPAGSGLCCREGDCGRPCLRPARHGGGRELAKCFPSRGAGDLIASAPWERLSGVFLVVSVFCFSFPAVFFQLGNVALLRFSRRAWKAAVCLRGGSQGEGCAERFWGMRGAAGAWGW